MKRIIVLIVLGAIVLAACGTDGADEPTGALPTDQAGIDVDGGLPLDPSGTRLAGMGPGISVADLLGETVEGPLLVNGYVFVFADGSVVLSDSIAESYPPQPAGDRVTVEGLDLMNIPIVEPTLEGEIAITGWTEVPVQLLGDLVDGVFVGNSIASI